MQTILTTVIDGIGISVIMSVKEAVYMFQFVS